MSSHIDSHEKDPVLTSSDYKDYNTTDDFNVFNLVPTSSGGSSRNHTSKLNLIVFSVL